MNRNVVTHEDVVEREGRENVGDGPEGQLTADDYWSRLIKLIPVEMISAYLIVQGLLLSGLDGGSTAQSIALAVLLAVTAVATWFFSARVLKVVRVQQLLLTVVALLVWAFAMGGWFATLSWWEAWMGTIAVVAFGVLVQIVALPPAIVAEPAPQQ